MFLQNLPLSWAIIWHFVVPLFLQLACCGFSIVISRILRWPPPSLLRAAHVWVSSQLSSNIITTAKTHFLNSLFSLNISAYGFMHAWSLSHFSWCQESFEAILNLYSPLRGRFLILVTQAKSPTDFSGRARLSSPYQQPKSCSSSSRVLQLYISIKFIVILALKTAIKHQNFPAVLTSQLLAIILEINTPCAQPKHRCRCQVKNTNKAANSFVFAWKIIPTAFQANFSQMFSTHLLLFARKPMYICGTIFQLLHAQLSNSKSGNSANRVFCCKSWFPDSKMIPWHPVG